jgi:Na+/H+ antiporter NhaD/arsenite permease-like protein
MSSAQHRKQTLIKSGLLLLAAVVSIFASTASPTGPRFFNIPVDFILFGLTLLGVALMHDQTLKVALTGLAIIVLYKLGMTGFKEGPGVGGLIVHMQHESILLLNLLGLLVGFALLADHFEKSEVPAVLPKYLPDSWWGGFMLLVIIFVLSAFLDNIAAALIGGTIAGVVFKKRIHIGYLAAIVAASNAGGAGSVVGDTTTTMMWIDGVAPTQVLEAFLAAAVALSIFGVIAARQQHAHQPIAKDELQHSAIDTPRLVICALILVCAVGANVYCNLKAPHLLDKLPVLALAVWTVLLLTTAWRAPNWSLLPSSIKGSIFLLALVVCASLMPVEQLPPASWQTALGLGFVSAVFDNIPLTALALKQGGYDWGFLAFAVGFGGSMVWFGSSAGVALSNMYPQAKSVGAWLKAGWHITVAYVIGFVVMLVVLGWHPQPKARYVAAPAAASQLAAKPQATKAEDPLLPPVEKSDGYSK